MEKSKALGIGKTEACLRCLFAGVFTIVTFSLVRFHLLEVCICSVVGSRTHSNIEIDPVASLPKRGSGILFDLHIVIHTRELPRLRSIAPMHRLI